MRIELFRSFIAIVEAGSANKAAKQLGIGQPAVTRRLQALEELMGETLIDRARRPWRPTAAGARTLAVARRTVHSAEALVEAIDGVRRIPTRQVVRIGLGPSSAFLFGKSLAREALKHRSVGGQVSFVHSTARNIIQMLLGGELDVGIADGRMMDEYSGLVVGPRFELPIRAWVHAEHPLLTGGPRRILELYQYPTVGPTPPAEMEEAMRPILPGGGSVTQAFAVVSDDITVLTDLALTSDTVMIALKGTVDTSWRGGALQPVPLAEPFTFSGRVGMGISPLTSLPATSLQWVRDTYEAVCVANGAERIEPRASASLAADAQATDAVTPAVHTPADL